MRKIIAKKALTQQELNSAYAPHTCDTSQQSLRLRFRVHDKTMRRSNAVLRSTLRCCKVTRLL